MLSEKYAQINMHNKLLVLSSFRLSNKSTCLLLWPSSRCSTKNDLIQPMKEQRVSFYDKGNLSMFLFTFQVKSLKRKTFIGLYSIKWLFFFLGKKESCYHTDPCEKFYKDRTNTLLLPHHSCKTIGVNET